jgi:hypothetical protein
MGNAQKALVMAAGIFLAIALITIAVIMFISAQDATKTAQANFSNIQTDLAQTAFTVYDNTTISGSQVVNALRKFHGTPEFGIQVMTGRDPAGIWYYNELEISSATSDTYGTVKKGGTFESKTDKSLAETGVDYVNPSGRFTASLIKDKSNVVRGIIFTQQP